MLDAVGSDPGPRVFVVVPVHDRCDLTRACLDSLAVQTYVRRTIVVVDDGSTDGTPDMLSSDFPDAVVLNGDGNLWWAGATNLGVAWVLGHAEVRDLVLTMNNDSVAGLDYLARLVASSLEHPHALIGSVSAPDDAPDVITEGAVRFNRVTGAYRIDGAGPRTDVRRLYPADLLSGRGTLVPVVVFRTLGLYDAGRLPHYGADNELSMRAKTAGYELLVDTSCVVISSVSMTGLNPSLRRLSWKEFALSFVSIRSTNNLWYRWTFYRRALRPWPIAVWFFAISTTRLAVHELRAQSRRSAPPATP